jgi:hypothetical protein
MPRLDITGQRYGRLVAVQRDAVYGSFIDSRGKRKQAESYWKFRCDCGTVKTTNLQSVRNGSVKSCGCLARDTHRAQTVAAQARAQQSIITAAREVGIELRTAVEFLSRLVGKQPLAPISTFDRKTVLEIARCYARAAFNGLVRDMEVEQTKEPRAHKKQKRPKR